MKKFTIILLTLTSGLLSHQYVDAIYLNNGSIIYGMIVESKPGEYYKIQTDDKVSIFYHEDIYYIRKEVMIDSIKSGYDPDYDKDWTKPTDKTGSNETNPVSSSSTIIGGEIYNEIHESDFSAPLVLVDFSGDDWAITAAALTSSEFIEEGIDFAFVYIYEASYRLSISNKVSLTLGRQSVPYGILNNIWRPADNWLVFLPRSLYSFYEDGTSLNGRFRFGGFDFLFENDDEWSSRIFFNLSESSNLGISINNYKGSGFDDQIFLLDGSFRSDLIDTIYEFNFSEDDDDVWLWTRNMIQPPSFKGVFFTFGFDLNFEDEEESDFLYGFGYKKNNLQISTEFSSEEAYGDDTIVKLSYSF